MKDIIRTSTKRVAGIFLRRWALWINAHRYEHEWQKARRLLPLLLPNVAYTLEKQRTEGGLSHRFSEYKLLELAMYMDQLQPRSILELGSGVTTAVLAEYANLRTDSVVVSVDESEHYLKKTQERLIPELRDRITFCHSARQTEIIDGTEVCYYDPSYYSYLPTKAIDLVYVDGPFCESPKTPGRNMPCVDILRLIESGYILRNILFDFRIVSVRYFLRSQFGFAYQSHLHPNVVAPEEDIWPVVTPRHHTWLQYCKDGPLIQWSSLTIGTK